MRESALLHAHQLESARAAYEHERARIDDEARAAKKGVREKLLAAVEERRRRLREEKEGGEVTVGKFGHDVCAGRSNRAISRVPNALSGPMRAFLFGKRRLKTVPDGWRSWKHPFGLTSGYFRSRAKGADRFPHAVFARKIEPTADERC